MQKPRSDFRRSGAFVNFCRNFRAFFRIKRKRNRAIYAASSFSLKMTFVLLPNAFSAISSADAGISISLSVVQPPKAFLPIVFKPSDKVTSARFSHFANALSPISVTGAGIVTETRVVQFINALSPIFVTEPSSGMTEVLQPYTKVFVAVSIMQFPSLWYTGLPSSVSYTHLTLPTKVLV